jgi:hypothetical protein
MESSAAIEYLQTTLGVSAAPETGR